MIASAALAALLSALVAGQLGSLLVGESEGDGRLRAVAGAVAFALAVALGTLAVPHEHPVSGDIRYLLLGGALVLIAGLRRDLGRPFRGATLLALLAAALIAVYGAGVVIRQVKIPLGPPEAPFYTLGATAGALLTVLWITAVGLLLRWIDPLPGLAAGQGFLASATFLVVALTRGREATAQVEPLTDCLAAVLLGACGGLAVCGRRQGGVSLGRGGAGMLGYLLGVLTVVGTLKNTAFLLIALPALSLAVPLLNLAFVRRRSGSVTAMLDARGFTHRHTVGLLLALQAYCCLVALVLVGWITVPVLVKLLLLALLLPAGFGAFFLISRIAARVATQTAGKVELLGLPVDAVTYDEALERMTAMVEQGGPHHVFTADVSGIMLARELPELAEAIRSCDLVTADGAGVLWAARLFDFPLPERVSGVDLVRRLSALAATRGWPVYLFGAQPGVADEAARVLQEECPGLVVAGVEHGYVDDEAAVAARIGASGARILFVALGMPRQERFIRRWRDELGVALSLGVGGSFDVISGRLKRAPGWMQRAGLEWLFRLVQQPSRWRRMLALPRFAWAIARESWRAWRRGPRAAS